MNQATQPPAARPEDGDDAARDQEPALDPEVVEKGKQRVGKSDSRLQVQEIFASVARSSGPAYHPIFEKFESEHVSQFLTQTHEADREERQLRRGNRWFRLGYVAIGVFIFVFLTLFLLPAHSDLYLEILKVLGIFGAGAAGGYGLRAYQDRRPDQSGNS